DDLPYLGCGLNVTGVLDEAAERVPENPDKPTAGPDRCRRERVPGSCRRVVSVTSDPAKLLSLRAVGLHRGPDRLDREVMPASLDMGDRPLKIRVDLRRRVVLRQIQGTAIHRGVKKPLLDEMAGQSSTRRGSRRRGRRF